MIEPEPLRPIDRATSVEATPVVAYPSPTKLLTVCLISQTHLPVLGTACVARTDLKEAVLSCSATVFPEDTVTLLSLSGEFQVA